jgi:hypothetical protein
MTLIFLLWIVLDIDGARVTDGIDDIGELLAALAADLVCGVTARRPSAGPGQLGAPGGAELRVGGRGSPVELLRPHQGIQPLFGF